MHPLGEFFARPPGFGGIFLGNAFGPFEAGRDIRAEALLRKLGADVRAGACIIELTLLKGRERLDIPFTSLIQYDS